MTPAPETPGQVLRNWINKQGLTQSRLARIMDRPLPWVNAVVMDKKTISPESAAQLGAALGMTPDYWLLVQDRYRLWVLSQDKQHLRRLEEIRQRVEENNK